VRDDDHFIGPPLPYGPADDPVDVGAVDGFLVQEQGDELVKLVRCDRISATADCSASRSSLGTPYCGAIGGQSAGSVTTRIGDPAR
jgi:hypothetical protein